MTDLEKELLEALERTDALIARFVNTLRAIGRYGDSLQDDVFARQEANVELIRRARSGPEHDFDRIGNNRD